MKLLHKIGPKINENYNTREEIIACDEPLSFDGVYVSVWENRDILAGKDVTLFVMGGYIGADNSFDKGQPYERLCDETQLKELVDIGCKIGWHTWTHQDLTRVDDMLLELEVTPPYPMSDFAYPYGRFNQRVIDAVKKAGFKRAYSVIKGNGSEYQLLRSYL